MRPEHHALVHPCGDLLPGLLEGYRGRLYGFVRGRHAFTFYCDGKTSGEGRVLPLLCWEARANAARFLAAGERCSECGGLGLYDACCRPHECPSCNGTGYTRKPADTRWMLDWPGEGLEPWESAALIGCSLARVAAGRGVVLGVKESAFLYENAEDIAETGAAPGAYSPTALRLLGLGYALKWDGSITLPMPTVPLVVREGDCHAL